MMMNSLKLALIRRVLDAPMTFETDDAIEAIEGIVINGIDPFTDDDDTDDDPTDYCGCCGEIFPSVEACIAHERTCCTKGT